MSFTAKNDFDPQAAAIHATARCTGAATMPATDPFSRVLAPDARGACGDRDGPTAEYQRHRRRAGAGLVFDPALEPRPYCGSGFRIIAASEEVVGLGRNAPASSLDLHQETARGFQVV
jgi:hypothetical protein